MQAFIGAALYLPLLPFAEFSLTVSWPALLAVLYLGAVVSVLAYLCYNQALTSCPPARLRSIPA